MKATDIYYFSGTGNTLLVARELQRTLQEHGVTVALHAIERTDPASVSTETMLGIGFPVACGSTYPHVWRFIHALPEVTGTRAFMFDTLASFSGGIVGPLRQVLRRKGYRCIGAREFTMPSNWLRLQDDAANQQCIEQTLSSVRAYAKALAEGSAHWGRVPIVSDVMGIPGRTRLPWRLLLRRWVSVDAGLCTKCGLCSRLCPVQNWQEGADGIPVSQQQCVLCMRCVAYCPAHAIQVHGKVPKTYRALASEDAQRTFGDGTSLPGADPSG